VYNGAVPSQLYGAVAVGQYVAVVAENFPAPWLKDNVMFPHLEQNTPPDKSSYVKLQVG